MLRTGNTSTRRRDSSPIPPSAHCDAILGDRVQMLYAATPLALIVTVGVALVFVFVHASYGDSDSLLYLWTGVMATVVMVRLTITLLYYRRPQRWGDEDWLRAFRGGAALKAASWGLAGILFQPVDQEAMQVFTILVIAGMAAGSLSSLMADYPSYRNYVFLSLAPVAGATLLGQNRLQMGVGLLVLLLMLFLLRSGNRASKSIQRTLQLRYENADLIEGLEREKRRLVTEAETMMSTVLASAPITLWAIDMDGIVTFFDGRYRDQHGNRRPPAIGDDLLQYCADCEEIVRDTRKALTGEELVSEVEIEDHAYEVHSSPLRDANGRQTGVMGVAIDISERKRHEQELIRRANYDDLTGLANRPLAMETIKGAFARARRFKTSVGMFFLDLDNFKSINDTLGHRAGDHLLCEAANRLMTHLRESDFAARLSGDEFLVIAENLHNQQDAEVLAHKVAAIFQEPFTFGGRELFITASAGIAVYPRDARNPHQLLQCADTAMYHAKNNGKNSYRFFTPEMQQQAVRHLLVETELHRALERNELMLYYQPKVDIQRKCISGAEVLLRWDSAELGPMLPDEFIPVAEVAGLMPTLGEWVLRTACREAATWESPHDTPIEVAINVSPQQFRKAGLQACVTRALAESGLPPSRLELEITESLLIQDTPAVVRTLNELNSLGIRLALDDFGTGYSSLSYLRKFPLQVLKIDKAFVQDLGKDLDSESLVYAIIAMAQSLRMQTVAEGVETAEQLQFLQARGVDQVQGYLFSRPVPADQFRALLAAGSSALPGLLMDQGKQEGSPLRRSG